jgi:hypothetical protein
MYDKLDHQEVVETLDQLIERGEDVLRGLEDELRQARSLVLTLTVKEHVVGSLSKEEESRREAALSSFRELRERAYTQQERLKKLRAARDDWEAGTPTSLQQRFAALLSS